MRLHLCAALSLPLLTLAFGCEQESSGYPTVILANGQALYAGTPEAMGLLAFVNDPHTTFEVLRHEAALPTLASRNLLAQRDGPDGIAGTADDQLFQSPEEVRAVHQVGPVSMQRLLDHASTHGFVPHGDDILGTYKNVTFTVNDAAAVLSLVNTANSEELRASVPLDPRAVSSIVTARPVHSVLQLSTLYFVGPVSLQRLKDRARQAADDIAHEAPLGTWKSVDFTVSQGELALLLVNNFAPSTLRFELPLDSRAVNAIVEARPLHSIGQLSTLYYVGTVALSRIRDHAMQYKDEVLSGHLSFTDCVSTSDCTVGTSCQGRPWDVPGAFGKCVPPQGFYPEEGMLCSADIPCGGETFCAGPGLYGDPWGHCTAPWMRASYVRTVNAEIPQDGSMHDSDVLVYGLASVHMGVTVTLALEHERPEDLDIRWLAPSGDIGYVHQYDNHVDTLRRDGVVTAILGGVPGDDRINGRWLLSIKDTGTGEPGRLLSWSLELASRWD